MLIQERQRLLSKLEEFDFLNPYASHSNFLLVKYVTWLSFAHIFSYTLLGSTETLKNWRTILRVKELWWGTIRDLRSSPAASEYRSGNQNIRMHWCSLSAHMLHNFMLGTHNLMDNSDYFRSFIKRKLVYNKPHHSILKLLCPNLKKQERLRQTMFSPFRAKLNQPSCFIWTMYLWLYIVQALSLCPFPISRVITKWPVHFCTAYRAFYSLTSKLTAELTRVQLPLVPNVTYTTRLVPVKYSYLHLKFAVFHNSPFADFIHAKKVRRQVLVTPSLGNCLVWIQVDFDIPGIVSKFILTSTRYYPPYGK